MNADDIRDHVLAALHRVAPDVETEKIPPDAELRGAVELDSIDFLSFVEELFTRTGIEVPERDYPSLITVDACVHYLCHHQSQSSPG